MYYFSVDYDVIDKSDILTDHKSFMVKNNIKQCSGLLNNFLLDF